MTEYTPTTQEVRNRYAWFGYDEGGSPSEADFAEIDRFLAARDAEVATKALEELVPVLSKSLSRFVDKIEHCDGGSVFISPEDFAAEIRKAAEQ